MIENYLPILIFIVIGVLFGVIPLIAGLILGPNNPNSEKISAYECGFEPFQDARKKFDVKFYLVAILFIIFDLEIVFLFPWAVIINDLSWIGVLSMFIFLIILTIGFIYEWVKGALEWE